MISQTTKKFPLLKHKLLPQCVLLGLMVMDSLSQWSHAQSNNQRWYQVELIAFARQNPDTQEYWPNNIKLGYPQNWVELKDPTKTPGEATATADQSAPAIDLLRDPFYFLPDSEKKLRNQANALQRDPRYRVLFHQAWRQFIGSQNRAQAIILNGGTAYGNHHELEGSITLSVAQFLQLRTRLWFSEYEINYGQAPGDWPQLPKTPGKLREDILAADTALAGEMSTFDSWSNLNTPSTETTLSNLSEPYLTKRIVLMEQDRRMRSNELHYLDHPLFGLIIQISPYNLPPKSADTTAP